MPARGPQTIITIAIVAVVAVAAVVESVAVVIVHRCLILLITYVPKHTLMTQSMCC